MQDHTHSDSSSFFDDPNSLSYQLWKKSIPLKKPSENKIYECVLFKRSKRTKFLKSRFYVLFDDRFAYYKNARDKVETAYCNLLNVKLDLISPEEEKEDKCKYGIKLSHNGQHCELFARTKDIYEKLIKHLAKFCVLSWYSTAYTDIKTIGKGSFAKVYLSQRNSDKQKFAVKTFSKALLLSKEKAKASLVNEICIMRKLQHANIISLEEVYESEHYIHLVLEVLHGGELFERIIKKGCYSEADACTLMQKLLTALEYMHSKGIMHRDIKPENLILKDTTNDWNIKIADFGLATCIHSGEFLFRRCGTPGYVAPEVLEDHKYDQKVDVFSAGVILYILLTGRAPFPGFSYNDLIRKNRDCQILFNFEEFNVKVSNSAIDLMKKMLAKDPENRYTVHQALNHDWILSGGHFLSPNTKTPIYLNSALENMKRCQQEGRFNVKNIKPKDLDKPSSLVCLEQSCHAPSPLITGRVSTIVDTKPKSRFGRPSPSIRIPALRSTKDSLGATNGEEIQEKPENQEISPYENYGSIDEVLVESNSVKNTMRKYSKGIAFPSLSRYTNPTKNTEVSPENMSPGLSGKKTATTANVKPTPTPQQVMNVKENLLKFLHPVKEEDHHSHHHYEKPKTETKRNQNKNKSFLSFLKPF